MSDFLEQGNMGVTRPKIFEAYSKLTFGLEHYRNLAEYHEKLADSLGEEVNLLRKALERILPDNEADHRDSAHGELDQSRCAVCLGFDALRTPPFLGEESEADSVVNGSKSDNAPGVSSPNSSAASSLKPKTLEETK